MNRYESSAAEEHRRQASRAVGCAVLTVSDTRSLDDDRSGSLIAELLQKTGQTLHARAICPDEPLRIEAALQEFVLQKSIEAIFVTGGTGVAPRDQTPETVSRLFTKELSGFGELFRFVSYQEIGAAAMLSRAISGLIDRVVVFVMPGSPAAVRLAMERLILPELGHLVELVRC